MGKPGRIKSCNIMIRLKRELGMIELLRQLMRLR